MKKLRLSLFILGAALTLASCSQQTQLADNLTRQSGRWNIDNYTITISTTGQPDDVTEYGDSGYMYFFTNNDGQWIDLKDPDEFQFIEFEWSITDANTLIIEYDNEEFEFAFQVNEKDRQVIVYTETVALTDEINVTTTIEYELLRIE
ncbi:MAG TPA: hypothetical protein DHW15_08055 [Bacteroidetes bacterium]|jgi:hypothetical protein|nr:MAG: hypothetical protein ABR94_07405 [Sphingobacteriales bacterium BACL12 MAG-120802-bin5]KRP13429.1 MAG: hypothetical protein ABR95_02585 [Sphingobacteriales bacterium BACL12 MAG-120813-bin55]HCK22097.1 hypothetical protein [Bacteroidota bacterium]